jgi:hypothetical protein
MRNALRGAATSPAAAASVAPLLEGKLVWLCEDQGPPLLAAVNFSDVAMSLDLQPGIAGKAVLVRSTDPARKGGEMVLDRFIVLPGEAVLLRIEVT